MNCTSGSATSGRLFRNAMRPVGSPLAMPSPLQISADQRRHDAIEPHRAMERARFFACIGDACRNVVLQILADAGQCHLDRDAVGGELGRIADAGQHQKLGRIDDAAAEDDFAFRVSGYWRTPLDIFDAGGAAAVENDLGRQRLDLDREIRPWQRRPQIGIRGAATAAVLHGHLPGAEAFLLGAVIVGRRLVSGGAAGRGEGIDQRVVKTRRLRRQRTLAAAIETGAAFPGFLAAEIGQHAGIGPSAQSGRRPALVIAGMAAHIGHRIDRRRAADDAAARAFESAPAGRRFRFREIHPVVLAVEQQMRPAERNLDPRIAVPAARLEQQHAACPCPRSAARPRCSRRNRRRR